MIKSFYNFPTKCFISVCRRRSCPHRPCRRVLRRSRNSVAVGRRRRCPPNRPCPCRRVLRRSRNSDAVGPWEVYIVVCFVLCVVCDAQIGGSWATVAHVTIFVRFLRRSVGLAASICSTVVPRRRLVVYRIVCFLSVIWFLCFWTCTRLACTCSTPMHQCRSCLNKIYFGLNLFRVVNLIVFPSSIWIFIRVGVRLLYEYISIIIRVVLLNFYPSKLKSE